MVYADVPFWGSILLDYVSLKTVKDTDSRKILLYSEILCVVGEVYSTYDGWGIFHMSPYFWFYLFFYIMGYGMSAYRVKKKIYFLYGCMVLLALWTGIAEVMKIPFIDL